MATAPTVASSTADPASGTAASAVFGSAAPAAALAVKPKAVAEKMPEAAPAVTETEAGAAADLGVPPAVVRMMSTIGFVFQICKVLSHV